MADIQTQLRKNELTTDYQSLQYWRTLCKEAADALDAKDKEIERLRAALEELYKSSMNEMVAAGLPLEWQDDCPMQRAKEALNHDR